MTSVYPGSGFGDSHPAPDPRPPSLVERILYPQWGPIVAGVITAAALALALHAFAVGIGLSVGSTAPTWRDAAFALVLLSALYVVLAALASYGLGGYLVGLMCARPSSREDADLRDGLHGLLVWALATLLTAVIGFACVSRKLDSAIVVMKAAEDGHRYNIAHVLDGAMDRSVLVERPMSPQLVIVGGILRQNPTQVRFAQDNHVVDALAPDRSDQPFGEAVLPRRAWGDGLVTDAHCS
jgi:hypothetical protein